MEAAGHGELAGGMPCMPPRLSTWFCEHPKTPETAPFGRAQWFQLWSPSCDLEVGHCSGRLGEEKGLGFP